MWAASLPNLDFEQNQENRLTMDKRLLEKLGPVKEKLVECLHKSRMFLLNFAIFRSNGSYSKEEVEIIIKSIKDYSIFVDNLEERSKNINRNYAIAVSKGQAGPIRTKEQLIANFSGNATY